MGKLMSMLSNKIFIITTFILVQFVLFVSLIFFVGESFIGVYAILVILSLVMAVNIIDRKDNPMYMILWIIIITSTPLFGGVWYLLFGNKKIPKSLRQDNSITDKNIENYIDDQDHVLKLIKDKDPGIYKQFKYISNTSGYPVYSNQNITNFRLGEDFYDSLIVDLKNADKFIYLEFFIIKEGYMWDQILEILIDKVKQGLDVRVMYDDAGSLNLINKNYVEFLANKGIKAKAFNKIKPRFIVQMNNRNHRKIVVIDGKIAYTGGINIGDEYINKDDRLGHWKDTGCRMVGECVVSFTFMFIQFWSFDSEKDSFNFDIRQNFSHEIIHGSSFLQPFSDTPTDNYDIGYNMHLNMINGAKDYIYINTPYLIIDYQMRTALSIAAQSGVDVRIVTPGIPDKKIVNMITKDNYKYLIDNGVKIYEYSPGFLHSKSFVSDDKIAVNGTVNMDFRSYFLHFECGVLIYGGDVILDMKEDFLKMLKVSKKISSEDSHDNNIIRNFFIKLIKVFAPLM